MSATLLDPAEPNNLAAYDIALRSVAWGPITAWKDVPTRQMGEAMMRAQLVRDVLAGRPTPTLSQAQREAILGAA